MTYSCIVGLYMQASSPTSAVEGDGGLACHLTPFTVKGIRLYPITVMA